MRSMLSSVKTKLQPSYHVHQLLGQTPFKKHLMQPSEQYMGATHAVGYGSRVSCRRNACKHHNCHPGTYQSGSRPFDRTPCRIGWICTAASMGEDFIGLWCGPNQATCMVSSSMSALLRERAMETDRIRCTPAKSGRCCRWSSSPRTEIWAPDEPLAGILDAIPAHPTAGLFSRVLNADRSGT